MMRKSLSNSSLSSMNQQQQQPRPITCNVMTNIYMPDTTVVAEYIKNSSIVNASIGNLIQCNATFPEDILTDPEKAVCVAAPPEVPETHESKRDKDFDRLAQILLRKRRRHKQNGEANS